MYLLQILWYDLKLTLYKHLTLTSCRKLPSGIQLDNGRSSVSTLVIYTLALAEANLCLTYTLIYQILEQFAVPRGLGQLHGQRQIPWD